MRSDLLTASQEALGYSGTHGLVLSQTRLRPGARDFVWQEMRDKCHVGSAYFLGAEPLVAFAEVEDARSVETLRKRLWNFGRVPILIASNDSGIAAFSCFVAPTASDQPAGRLATATNVDAVVNLLSDFTRTSMESGEYLRSDPDAFRKEQRVDRRLLASLRDLRRPYGGSEDVQAAVDHLVGQAVFVRYLEDRGVLTEGHIDQLASTSSLISALELGRQTTFRLLEGLSERFNGDVFPISAVERQQITDAHCMAIGEFFKGTDLTSGQQSFWPFDFSVIPPELLSSIYEQLLEQTQKKNAAYYTPRQLVTAMLDEVVPWNANVDQRILDPACGSGVFLAEAYRRCVYRVKRLGRADVSLESLAKLMTASIFGVDKSEQAIRVTAFSLYLALLDEVETPTVWEHARLPTLMGRNLLVDDFFQAEVASNGFDVIVANPPWESALTSAASEFLVGSRSPIADKQIAMAFLWKSVDLLRPDGRLAFLMPAKPLLHNKSTKAVATRSRILEVLDVATLMDLSPLRKKLFANASGPASILVGLKSETPDQSSWDEDILHVVARDSPAQAALDGLVLASDDVHRVTPAMVAGSSDLWSVLVWGNERDVKLISRLREHNSLKEVTEDRQWLSGHGFQVTGRKRTDATDLVGSQVVEARAIRPFAVSEFTTNHIDRMLFPRNRRLYKGPHVLIRVGFYNKLPAATFVSRDTAFPHGVIGISGPAKDAERLALVAVVINSTIGRYFQFMTSASWGVEREFVELGEHRALPVPDWEGAASRDLRSLAREHARGSAMMNVRQRTIDTAVAKAFGLEAHDLAHIRLIMTERLDQFDRGIRSSVYEPPSADEADAYSKVLQSQVNMSLPSLGISALPSVTSGVHRGLPLLLGPRSSKATGGRHLGQELLEDRSDTIVVGPSPSVLLQRSVIVIDGNVAAIVKTNERRSWMSGEASSDAAELVGALVSLPSR